MLRFVPGIATNSQAVSDIFTRHMNCPRSKNQHVSKAKIRRFPAHRKPAKKVVEDKEEEGKSNSLLSRNFLRVFSEPSATSHIFGL